MTFVKTEDNVAPFDHASEFSAAWMLYTNKDEYQGMLPGQPRVRLDDTEQLYAFLEREFWSWTMDAMTHVLWMMSTQSHTNISPLHRQSIKGRQIIVAEDPKLHLVWFHNRIFIKPLPRYLCSYTFWGKYLTASDGSDPRVAKIRASALGYLRTWFYLIQYESDFRIAQSPDLQLIPKDLSWVAFCKLSATFDKIEDKDVWSRYHFGEIRLTRLNFYSKFVIRRWSFQRMYSQYGDYFARFYGPLLFAFAIISVLLNSFQVVMSVEQVATHHWTAFWGVARWFSTLCVLAVVTISLCLAILLLFKIAAEWRQALADHRRDRGADVEK